MIDGEKSLLPLVNFDDSHSWDSVWTLCTPFIETHGAEMLQKRLDGVVKAVAVERHYIDRDYRDTFSNYHSKRFSTPISRTLRLHFFDKAISNIDLLDHSILQGSYRGYAVIRPTRPSCLGRTMISPKNFADLKDCLLRICRESITLQGTPLEIGAFPFISQDTDATVCAQSALWMLFRYFSTQYAHYFSDYTKLLPPDDRIASSFFNSGFVINDDNWMPYQRLPIITSKHQDPFLYSRHSVDSLQSFIAPLPEKVFLAAEHQQKVVERLLNTATFGFKENSPILASGQIITRSFLTSGRSFKRTIQTRSMGNPRVAEIFRTLPMPRFIWVTEIAKPNEFPHQVRGEVLWDATRNGHEVDGWIAIHYPEFLALDIGSALNELPNIKKFKLDNHSPYNPYKNNLECLT